MLESLGWITGWITVWITGWITGWITTTPKRHDDVGADPSGDV